MDIGILRTMGVTQGAIMRVFMITGASVGVVGTLVGFLLALAVPQHRIDPPVSVLADQHRAVLARALFSPSCPPTSTPERPPRW